MGRSTFFAIFCEQIEDTILNNHFAVTHIPSITIIHTPKIYSLQKKQPPYIQARVIPKDGAERHGCFLIQKNIVVCKERRDGWLTPPLEGSCVACIMREGGVGSDAAF